MCASFLQVKSGLKKDVSKDRRTARTGGYENGERGQRIKD